MADTETTDLTELTTPASDDLVHIIDVSDTTFSAEGTDKKIEIDSLGILTGWIPDTAPTFASATTFTVAGDMTSRYTKGTKFKATWTGGSQTKALDLESGSSQYASIADGSQTGLDITGSLSLECWFKPESIGAAQYLLSKWDTNSQRSYALVLNDTGKLLAWASDDGSFTAGHYSQTYGSTVLSAGTWYHVAMTFNSSTGAITLYVNGVNDSSTDSVSTSATSVYNGTAPFSIGARFGSGVPSYPTDGIISEARVWDDLRTQDEIRANMFRNVSTGSNLQGYWKLDNAYTDASGNGNTLTASGSPVFASDVPAKLTSGVGYFYVVSSAYSASTTVTVTGEMWLQNTTLAGYYSYNDCPRGFKRGEDWFSASAYLASNEAILSSVSEILIFGTELHDTNGNYNNSTGIYTTPIAGKYSIQANVTFDVTAAADRIRAWVYRAIASGGNQLYCLSQSPPASVYYQTIVINTTIQCEKGDSLSIYCINGDNNDTIIGGEFVSAYATSFSVQFTGL